jgi:hypothetical protein
MLKALLPIALWAISGAVFAEDGIDDPTFAMPIFTGGESVCGSQPVAVYRTRANTVLSIARTGKGEPGKEFLEVGPRSRQKDSANCVIDVRFERPLAEVSTLGIDFSGVEQKSPGATASLTIELGAQRHVFDYPRGRMLDATVGKVTKRFQMVDLPAGTRRVRISISGKAARAGHADSALIGFDALDLCFVSGEEQPEFCGAPGYPNPRAMP